MLLHGALTLLALRVRAWPGGTGNTKVGGNYAMVAAGPLVRAFAFLVFIILYQSSRVLIFLEAGSCNFHVSFTGGLKCVSLLSNEIILACSASLLSTGYSTAEDGHGPGLRAGTALSFPTLPPALLLFLPGLCHHWARPPPLVFFV